jgi:hypothetical protein
MYNVFQVPYLLHNGFNLIVAVLLVWAWTRMERRLWCFREDPIPVSAGRTLSRR